MGKAQVEEQINVSRETKAWDAKQESVLWKELDILGRVMVDGQVTEIIGRERGETYVYHMILGDTVLFHKIRAQQVDDACTDTRWTVKNAAWVATVKLTARQQKALDDAAAAAAAEAARVQSVLTAKLVKMGWTPEQIAGVFAPEV